MFPTVDSIRVFHDELKTIRHDIHAHPELGFQETRTSELVARELARLQIETVRGLGGTGVVGIIKGKKSSSGRAIGLRAELDCLPIQEATDVPWRSVENGRMHACGHDGHATMLLGAARHLSSTKNFDGTVYVIFQPAEEGGGGGERMVQDGLFQKLPMDEVYALHNWPALPPGKIAVRPGPVMAAMDEFTINIAGKGGHAAMPHLNVDPVVASAQVITALQTIASRNVDPADSVVVSVTTMHSVGPEAFNVIPDSVKLTGTLRAFRPETRALAEKRLHEIVNGVAHALGTTASINYRRGYPPTVNTKKEAEFAARIGTDVFGVQNVILDADPSMGAEDFAYMLQAKPGAYIWLGQGGGPMGCFLHNPGYDFNDDVIPWGAGYLAALVEQGMPLR